MAALSGWINTAGSETDVAAGAAADPRAPLFARLDERYPFLSGASWRCTGPATAERDGRVVVIQGDPLWRTTDSRITGAPDPAGAVLEAYAAYGPGFLELLHGSFALAILDTRSREALLAVDRMGIERLAYCAQGSELTFSTSAERVARSRETHPRIRPQSVLEYLFFHMVPSPGTVFEGVRKVPPATAVTFKDGKASEYPYWRPAFVEPPQRAEPFEALRSALSGALAAGVLAARPDDRTGAFLSGGLDSSTVAGMLGKVTARPPRTFSIGFGVDDYDELRYARIAVAHFGAEAREYQAGPEDVIELIPTIAAACDEPFGNASALPTLCCARLAREHGIDHLLAGDGGDEIFAGNKRYAEQLVFERYQRVPAPLRRALLEPTLRGIPAALRISLIRKAYNYVASANTPLPDRLESWNFLYRLGFDTVLHPEFAKTVDPQALARHMREVYRAGSSNSVVNRMLNYDWRFTLADNDLRKVGTMCGVAGVRVSYPMLHPDVIDVSLRVPPQMKMRGTELRTFYKRALADFLPAQIITKTKHGFGLPFGLWLRSSPPLMQLIRENLAGLRARGIVREEFIDRLLDLHAADDASYYGVMLWNLAMLEQWFREHRLAPA